MAHRAPRSQRPGGVARGARPVLRRPLHAGAEGGAARARDPGRDARAGAGQRIHRPRPPARRGQRASPPEPDLARRGIATRPRAVAAQPDGALGRGRRAPARRRMGARRPRRHPRRRVAQRAAARCRATDPCLAPEAAGGAPRSLAAGGAEDGAAARQASGLLDRRGRRALALAGVRVARHGARCRPAASPLAGARSRRSARSVHRRPRGDAGEHARRPRRRAQLAAPALGADRRPRLRGAHRGRRGPRRRGAGDRRRVAGAARGGVARPCRAMVPSRLPREPRSPSAASGARRGHCSSRPAPTSRCRRRRDARPGSRSPSSPARTATRPAPLAASRAPRARRDDGRCYNFEFSGCSSVG